MKKLILALIVLLIPLALAQYSLNNPSIPTINPVLGTITTSGGGGSGNVTSVNSGDGCVLVSPTTGDVFLTLNTSCISSTGDGSYNATYAMWAYNQTQVVYANPQFNNTYNATYAQFAYNHTAVVYSNPQFNNTYNASYANLLNPNTSIVNCANVTGNSLCQSGSPTFNGGTFNGASTFNALQIINAGGFQELVKYTALGFFNVGHITTENGFFQLEPFSVPGVGFDLVFGNLTKSYMSMTDSGRVLFGASVDTVIGDITGVPIASFNTGVVELHNSTVLANGTIISPSIARSIRQKEDIVTTNHTVFNNTELGFSLVAGRNYSLDCTLLYTSAIATTGQTINVSSTATTYNPTVSYQTWSSATAKVGFSATSLGTALVGTGSGGAVIYQSNVIADFGTTSTGSINISTRSEIGGSVATLKRGSRCELYDIT